MTEIIFRELTPEELAEYAELAEQQEAEAIKIAEDNRRAAYQRISDPIYFKWQRGEATEQEYLDAVEQVRNDYPIPGE